MKFSLLLSTALHLSLLTLVFWQAPETAEMNVISQVQLISLKQEQRAQRKRAHGTKSAMIGHQKNVTKSTIQKEEKVGADRVDTKEVKVSQGVQVHKEITSYGQELKEYLERNRYYPRRAQALQQTGVVKLRFRINPDGSFAHVEILEASKYSLLNKATKNFISRLKAFKPLPESYRGKGEFVVSLNYQLNQGKN